MTTPKSGRSTANHFQDHLDDESVREQLRSELIAARKATGFDVRTLARCAGRGDEWLYQLEQRSNSAFWLFDSVNQWGRAVGLDVWAHPNIQPVLPENKIGSLARAGISYSVFSGVGFLEYCRDWRVFHDIEQRHIMAELDIVHSTAWAIEESTNPRISSMQRYIRALGGVLEFHTERFEIEPPRSPAAPF